jgi:hypothetical protein
MSTLSLAKNGRVSSSKETKHIKAKYFFIKHYYDAGEIDLKYCHTDKMWADILTKLLQGTKVNKMRAVLMNCNINYSEEETFHPAPLPIKSFPTKSPMKP